MRDEDPIRCRAKFEDSCHDQEPCLSLENPNLDPWREDRTYDSGSDTIVCDHCFLLLPDRGRFDTLEDLARLMARVVRAEA